MTFPNPSQLAEGTAVNGPELLGAIAVIALIAAGLYVFKPRRPPGPPPVQPTPVLPTYQPAPIPDLLDLHYAYGERREREQKYERYKAALDGIALLTSTPTPPNA